MLTPSSSLSLLANLLERKTGQYLSEDRLWRVEASLYPLLRKHGIASLDALANIVAAQPDGAVGAAVVDALLNNETCFYRDPHIFRMLAEYLFPALMKRREQLGTPGKVLTIWCAGCSAGQEAFSLAMMFRNNRDRWPNWHLRVVGTDISGDAIRKARAGLFSQAEVQRGLPINDLLRWFVPDTEQWRISTDLRSMVDFRQGNLLDDDGSLLLYDAILCRNVLFYFSQDRKNQLLHILARHVVPGGYVLLGAGETMIGQRSEFISSPLYKGVYERVESPSADIAA